MAKPIVLTHAERGNEQYTVREISRDKDRVHYVDHIGFEQTQNVADFDKQFEPIKPNA